MRILIGNHIDDSLLLQKDQRAFAQRIFWFAQNGDAVVLSAPPDAWFLEHVASLTGLDPSSLSVHVVPSGRFEGRLLEPDQLCDDSFVGELRNRIRGQAVSEVFALWPSAQVAELAERLGVAETMPGSRFFAQQGDELANNKGNFRAFAAASGAPIADGAVCRSRAHAKEVLQRLLVSGAVMVKQAHNGAGQGNQLVWPGDAAPVAQPGAAHLYHLRSGGSGVERYLEERWDWASVHDRFPVVIERFIPRTRTVYAEFIADDAGVRHTEAGTLGFRDGRLVEETVPLRGLDAATHDRLVSLGTRLAETYRAFGYRGPLSADAVVDEDERITFTEVNARVGGSLHLYQVIGNRIVQMHQSPERSLVQYVTGQWRIQSAAHFIEAAAALGLAYDHATRKGVIVSMPLAGEPGRGGLLFCVAYAEHAEARDAYHRLAERLC